MATVNEILKVCAPLSENPRTSETYQVIETNITRQAANAANTSSCIANIFDRQTYTVNGEQEWMPIKYIPMGFNGTSSYAKIMISHEMTNFTVEAWVYLNVVGKQQYFFNSEKAGLGIGISSGNKLMIVRSGVATDRTVSGYTFVKDVWQHVAVTKDGNNFVVYINGAKIDSWTSSNAYPIKDFVTIGSEINTYAPNGGYWLNGYVEGLRVFDGAKYTKRLVCPQSYWDYADYNRVELVDPFETYPELLNISHTKDSKVRNDMGIGLLHPDHNNTWDSIGTGRDNTFISGFPLKFLKTNASAEALTYPLYIAKDATFTVDFWAKTYKDSSIAGNIWPVAFDWKSNITQGRGHYLHVIDHNNTAYVNAGSGTSASAWAEGGYSSHVIGNTWNHYAFVKGDSNKCTVYVNGVASGRIIAGNGFPIPQEFSIGEAGSVNGDSPFYGSIDKLRVCYGERWTTNFAVPSRESDYDESTKTVTDATAGLKRTAFLLKGSLKDSSATKVKVTNTGVTLVDGGKVSSKALYFDGTGNTYITVKLAETYVDNKDFTLDWWEYRENNGTIACLNTSATTAYSVLLISHQGGKLYGSYADSTWDRFSGVQAFDDSIRNTWTHYALVKKGTQYTTYKNGVQYWTATQNNSLVYKNSTSDSDILLIGKHHDNAGPNGFQGKIDCFRFSTYARWTENFTPPQTSQDYSVTKEKNIFKTGNCIEANCCKHYDLATTFPKGKYKIEAWGASGGAYGNTTYGGGVYNTTTYMGGSGGYSTGILTLTEDTPIHAWVGGIGQDLAEKNATSAGTVLSGGINGGGSAKIVSYSSVTTYPSGGGGMTDVLIGCGETHKGGILVAGGGSGATNFNDGYAGGGLTGDGYTDAYKGKQTAGGNGSNKTHGANASPSSTNYRYAGSGAGGGWYGGGSTSTYSDSDSTLPKQNGGGSGFVFTAETASSVPSTHTLSSKYYLTEATTIAGNVEHPEINGLTAATHFGSGYLRITVLSGATDIRYKDDNGWKSVSKILVKEGTSIVEVWKELEFEDANAAQQILMPYVNKISKSNTFYSWSRYNLGDPHTKLLINGSGATVKDISNYDQALSVNNVELNTEIKKFNNASLAFKYGRSNSWIEFNASNVFDWNSDWTIDWWEYIPSIVNVTCIYNQTTNAASSDKGILLGYQSSSNNEYFYCTSTTSSWDICNSVNMGAITVNQWVHRAIVRSGNNYYTFRDGTLISTNTSTKTILAGANIGAIGRYANGISYFKGLIDDFRISDEARWTANFSVPTSSPTGKTYEGIVTANDKAAYPSKGIGSGGYYYVRW